MFQIKQMLGIGQIFFLGCLLMFLGGPAVAVEQRQAAAEPLVDLTWKLLEEGRYLEARETIEAWEQLQPEDPLIPLLKRYAMQLEQEPDPLKREELFRGFVGEGMSQLVDKMGQVSQGLEDLNRTLEWLEPEGMVDQLTLAATQGEAAEVERLLTQGVDPNQKDSYGMRALEHAATRNRLKVAEFLLDYRADVNARGLLGVTPLMLAAGKGHRELVQLLIDRGGKVNLESETGLTALSAAKAQRHFHIVQLLRQAGATKSKALMKTTGPLTQESLPEMLSSGDKDSDLLDAALGGHLERVRLLLDQKADVDAKGSLGMTPLMFAAQSGHLDALNMLLHGGADVSLKSHLGYTALMSAAMEGHTYVAQAMILWKADVNAQGFAGMTALMHAVANNHTELVGMLIAWGAEVDLRNDFGMTSLMFAAQNGHLEMADLLLQEGADPSVKEEIAGQTALALAERKEHWDVAEILQDASMSSDDFYDQSHKPMRIE